MLFSKDGKNIVTEIEQFNVYKSNVFPSIDSKGTLITENEKALVVNPYFNAGYKETMIESDANIFNLNNNGDGIGSFELQGNTLKNELTYNKDTWSEWTKNAGVVGDGTGLEFTADGVGYKVGTIPTNLKPSTKYGLLYNVVSSSIVNDIQLQGSTCFNWQLIPKTIGNNKVIATTLTNITSNILQIQTSINTEPSGNKIKLKDIRIYELPTGSQIETDFNTLTADQLASKYPWHSGISSVGESESNKIEVLSRGKNLFPNYSKFINSNLFLTNDNGVFTLFRNDNFFGSIEIGYIIVKPNTNYTLSTIFIKGIPSELVIHYMIDSQNAYFDGNGKTILTDSSGKLYLGLTTPGNNANINALFMIQIEENKLPTSYESYQEDKINISLANPLRKVGMVADKIDSAGIIARNIGKNILNGTESWNIDSTDTNTIRFFISTSPLPYGYNFFTDKFIKVDNIPSIDNESCGSSGGGYFEIRIAKSKLITQDVAGFKTWLASNNVTVYYELATPTTENLNQLLSLKTFENGSMSINTAISPHTKITFNNNLYVAYLNKYLLLEFNNPKISNVNMLGFLLNLNSNNMNVYVYKNGNFSPVNQNLDLSFKKLSIDFLNDLQDDKIYMLLESNSEKLSISDLNVFINYSKKLGIIQHMPRYYLNSEVGNNLCGIIDIENENIINLTANMINQFIVSTATYMLSEYEKQYGLPVNPSISFDERRSRIKAKLRSVGPVNKEMIQNLVNAWTNSDIEVIEDYANYTVTIKFVSSIGIPANMQDVYNAINEIKPAHLIFLYEFKYRRYEELKVKTHQQLSSFTHNTIREGVI